MKKNPGRDLIRTSITDVPLKHEPSPPSFSKEATERRRGRKGPAPAGMVVSQFEIKEAAN
jgi:hypothetical protein